VREVRAAPRPPRHGQAILRTLSSGSAAVALKIEDALEQEGWEEF
jgi:hypothetical protein